MAPGSQNVAVIKSNAYGHGAVEVARALHGDAPAFAVAFFEEAVELREAGITKPILILQGILGDEKVAEAASSVKRSSSSAKLRRPPCDGRKRSTVGWKSPKTPI